MKRTNGALIARNLHRSISGHRPKACRVKDIEFFKRWFNVGESYPRLTHVVALAPHVR